MKYLEDLVGVALDQHWIHGAILEGPDVFPKVHCHQLKDEVKFVISSQDYLLQWHNIGMANFSH